MRFGVLYASPIFPWLRPKRGVDKYEGMQQLGRMVVEDQELLEYMASIGGRVVRRPDDSMYLGPIVEDGWTREKQHELRRLLYSHERFKMFAEEVGFLIIYE